MKCHIALIKKNIGFSRGIETHLLLVTDVFALVSSFYLANHIGNGTPISIKALVGTGTGYGMLSVFFAWLSGFSLLYRRFSPLHIKLSYPSYTV